MDALESELRVSPPPSIGRKSPPLAFAPTSNDSLAPLISPGVDVYTNISALRSRSRSPSPMGHMSPPAPGEELGLQVIVDQQAHAIQLLHEAFGAERQVWCSEKIQLHQRIAKLEQLLNNRHHYSPAKSPIISPLTSASITSPSSRALCASQKLPSIAEDENMVPLSHRREGAPRSIKISGRPPLPAPQRSSRSKSQRGSSVTFDAPSLMIDEVPVSPPTTTTVQSPPPLNNRALAGHTPMKSTRPSTPQLQNLSMDGIEDTPTRNNTHNNIFLSRSTPEEEDKELKGPLSMPELPNEPSQANFTLEALSQRLERIVSHPEEAKPMVFSQPTPGLASPASPAAEKDAKTANKSTDDDSNTISPSATISPNGAPITHQPSHESQKFEVGGIKLKKKASNNFGVPFGQLGGFGAMRRQS
ncbi:hypothetical protein B0A50_03124 [Salinomyces thailandicus]|uniref:Uncharacterized protein n=1 Tax=Salinomyces thailandicus TaxID=706561 RepID=A0A4U0U3V5_9PEZI|nr:hypothetical protein B0A50_03124 [Salinomyces thailandica]